MTMQKEATQTSSKTQSPDHCEGLVMVQEELAWREQRGLRRQLSSGDKSTLSTPSGPTQVLREKDRTVPAHL